MPYSRKDTQDDNNHWDKLFALCACVIASVIIYCFLITFVPIPADNAETARQVLIFFIGTLVGYCFNLLSPGITSKKSIPQLNVKGDNTNISGTSSANIEISPKEPDEPPADQVN